MDWQDALNSLKDTMPEGNDTDSVTESPTPTGSPKKARLDISLEKKGRAGKCATIISGFTTETEDEISAIAAKLKSALGTGGSARGGEILIQGDRRADLGRKLAEMGYKSRNV